MKSPTFILALLCPILSIAQPRPLQPGDTIPPPAMNYIAQQAGISLQQLKGKAIILDFMASWCGSCIAVLPRSQSLQQQYSSHLGIILVTSEPYARFNAFRQKNKLAQQLSLPVITDDSILSSYFPHLVLSHLAWIDSKQTLRAITGSSWLSASNINDFIAGLPIRWPVKNDFLRYNFKQPLWSLNHTHLPEHNAPAAMGHTGFSSHMPGLQHGHRRWSDSSTGTIRISMINLSVAEMIRAALNLSRQQPLIFQWAVQDSTQYVFTSSTLDKEAWQQQHTFCYEALIPISTPSGQLQQKILTDLSFWLGLHITVGQQNNIPVVTIREENIPPLKNSPNNHQP